MHASLDRLPADIARPAYAFDQVGIGIVHLGIGAFHRAHQAIYTDDALAHAGGAWGICGVSLRSPDVRDRLAPQDGLYTAIEKSPDRRAPPRRRQRARGAVPGRSARRRSTRRLDGPRDAHRLADRDGERLLPRAGDGPARLQSSGHRSRLAHPDAPRSVPGLLVAALDARRRAHGAPLTVVCCDNLPQNGALVCGLVVAFANMREPSLADWISREVAFPSTMVDRIVPATTADDIARERCGARR